MASEQLEFLISQYADGTLGAEERTALEGRLADEAEARRILAEDRSLTDLLRSMPLPEVDWDRLSTSISESIDRELGERVARASWWMRNRIPTGLALAASVFIALGVAIRILLPSRSSAGDRHPLKKLDAQTVAMLNVDGPQEDAPTGPQVTEISIGAGGSYAHDSALAPYADEIDNRPARIVIASGTNLEPPQAGPY
jgi:anti-sigma factor RsiW